MTTSLLVGDEKQKKVALPPGIDTTSPGVTSTAHVHDHTKVNQNNTDDYQYTQWIIEWFPFSLCGLNGCGFKRQTIL